jgi:hypothetical protein
MDLADLRAFSDHAATAGRSMCPARVLLAGVEYAATIPTPAVVGNLANGLTIDEGALVCRILLSDMPNRPMENQPLKWKRPGEENWQPVVWWVEAVTRAPQDVEWRLSCHPKN